MPHPVLRKAAFIATTSRQFVSWLADSGSSLAISTYQSGKVVLIGTNRQAGRLSVFERTLERTMGMAVPWLAAGHRVDDPDHKLRRMPRAARRVRPVTTRCSCRNAASYTADLDVHDLAYDTDGRLVFVNTLFSCLATTSETHSFKPLWKPPSSRGWRRRIAAT